MTWDEHHHLGDLDDLSGPPLPTDDDEDLSDVDSNALGVHEVDVEDWPLGDVPDLESSGREPQKSIRELDWTATLKKLEDSRLRRDWRDVERLSLALLHHHVGTPKGDSMLVKAARLLAGAALGDAPADKLPQATLRMHARLQTEEARSTGSSRSALQQVGADAARLFALVNDGSAAALVRAAGLLRGRFRRPDLAGSTAAFVLDFAPQESAAHVVVAASHLDLGNLTDAAEALEQAKAIREDEYWATSQTRLWSLSGRHADALELAVSAFERWPNKYTQQSLRSAAEKADNEDAQQLAESVDLPPDSPRWRLDLLLAARTLYRAGRLTAASQAIHKVTAEGKRWREAEVLQAGIERALRGDG